VTEPTSKNATPVTFWRDVAEFKAGRRIKRPMLPNHLIPDGSINRQQFLKVMGASIALAGLTGCATEPKGPTGLAPYVSRPPGITEDQSILYASALTTQGYAQGVLVRAVSGRPIKIEGNPQHPQSLGATTIFEQASLLTFYDPDRSRSIVSNNQNVTWGEFVSALQTVDANQQAKQGSGLRILTQTITSPSLGDQLNQLLAKLPSAKIHQWEPVNRDNVLEGSQRAFGAPVNPVYRVDQADVILTLDADFLNAGPDSLRNARGYASKRVVTPTNASQSRVYAVESTPSVTGTIADHRLPVKARDVQAVGRAIAAGVGVPGVGGALPAGVSAAWVAAVVADLGQHRGSSLVVAGDQQPPDVHHLAHQLNQTLGNVGKTVSYVDSVEFSPVNKLQSLVQLVQDMNAGAVEFLLMIGGNPVYDAPADLGFAAALKKVGQSVHLSLHQDETSVASSWHVPLAHEIEAWGDARAIDGTTTIIQPVIEPLYGGRTPQELVAILAGQPPTSAHDLIKGYWQRQLKGADPELQWRSALASGIVPGTTLAAKAVTLKPLTAAAPVAATGTELNFRPDPTIWDGRYANNGWLQELPKPVTQLTWDNVAYVGPTMAQRLGVNNADVVEVRYRGGLVLAPIYVLAGHPDDAVTLHLGYGRANAGQVGNGIGYNAYPLRTSAAPWFDTGVELRPTGNKLLLATTQGTQDMEGRDPVLAGTLDAYRKDTTFLQKLVPESVGTLYPPSFPYNGNRWGMTINLSACIGCNACIVACQAENNIPVVGKTEVAKGRHMHWLRVDRYYEGQLDNPTSYVQPIPCQQCENAPCELVCPVDATTHSDEGLNDMVYNRCVGTRYCSNNCPYKVRRFNFFQYADYTTPSLQLLYNPDVSVRERGVMEKCTYCVQRIRQVDIIANREKRGVRDGEIQTACQAACPTRAFSFGNLNDPTSEVAKLKADPLNYSLLADLNTRPRTTYLGVIRNPNPAIQAT
jgi:molybdopterin-containing oxidoreductase family iron-sulfur binding subunit